MAMIHKAIIPLSIEGLKNIAKERSIYIWGAGNQGRGIAAVLLENSISPVGFIDASKDMIGKEILSLPVSSAEFISTTKKPPFVIISVFFYEQEIRQQCIKLGLKEGESFIHYSRLKPRDYSIDVSGGCNLKCISCPRATHSSKERSAGLMSLDTFKQVIQKIRKEDPFVGNIQLYQWGEPILNKELPEMLSYARAQGVLCAISSNLNKPADYRAIISANPEWFRISASGWGKEYEIAHTGGNWHQFRGNLEEIASLRQELYPEMKLELYYHIYKHSVGEPLRKFQALCEEFEIEFHPVYAYLISLDDVLRYKEGTKLPKDAVDARSSMFWDLDEGLQEAYSERALPCDAFRSVHINNDLSVSNCMMYYYPQENMALSNYLEKGIDEIMEIRGRCNLCERCIKQGIHRYCGVYSTKEVNVDELAK